MRPGRSAPAFTPEQQAVLNVLAKLAANAVGGVMEAQRHCEALQRILRDRGLLTDEEMGAAIAAAQAEFAVRLHVDAAFDPEIQTLLDYLQQRGLGQDDPEGRA